MSKLRKSEMSDMNQLISKANKRYRRLEKRGWKTGAYKKAMSTGGAFHNKRGSSYREKAREYQRVKNFLNAKTSTVRGSKKVVKNMLNRTGLSDIVGTDVSEILIGQVKEDGGKFSYVQKFFDIASMVDEYLENHRGAKISSDEIWRSIHDTYLKGYDKELSNIDPDEMVANIVRRLHNDYLKSHGSSSSKKTWSTI